MTAKDTITRELAEQGVTVAYAPLGGQLAVWDGPRGTFTVHESAPEMDQWWVLTQMWARVVVGPSASSGFEVVE